MTVRGSDDSEALGANRASVPACLPGRTSAMRPRLRPCGCLVSCCPGLISDPVPLTLSVCAQARPRPSVCPEHRQTGILSSASSVSPSIALFDAPDREAGMINFPRAWPCVEISAAASRCRPSLSPVAIGRFDQQVIRRPHHRRILSTGGRNGRCRRRRRRFVRRLHAHARRACRFPAENSALDLGDGTAVVAEAGLRHRANASHFTVFKEALRPVL